jgi:O-antigen/teichoic acid export membrane protein
MFAEYHVGAFQIPILTTVAYSIGAAYTPTFTELIRADKAREAIALWRGTIEKTALIVVPLSAIFVIAAEPFMELLFTKDYSHAASVFRWYALATAGRVAAFGTVIVAAGKPRLLLRAGLITLGLNAVFSLVGLHLLGFEGPAAGACAAFIPTVIAYCYYIAQATGLKTREIFPALAYLKVAALTAVSILPALAFERLVDAPPALEVVAVACLVLAAFILLGRSSGLITAADLAFLKQRFARGGSDRRE